MQFVMRVSTDTPTHKCAIMFQGLTCLAVAGIEFFIVNSKAGLCYLKIQGNSTTEVKKLSFCLWLAALSPVANRQGQCGSFFRAEILDGFA